jgi:hypothetical protein
MSLWIKFLGCTLRDIMILLNSYARFLHERLPVVYKVGFAIAIIILPFRSAISLIIYICIISFIPEGREGSFVQEIAQEIRISIPWTKYRNGRIIRPIAVISPFIIILLLAPADISWIDPFIIMILFHIFFVNPLLNILTLNWKKKNVYGKILENILYLVYGVNLLTICFSIQYGKLEYTNTNVDIFNEPMDNASAYDIALSDMFITEYRFWLLFGIWCIYSIVVTARHDSATKLSDIIYKPLDHLLKYNLFLKYYYYTFMDYFIAFLYKRTQYELKLSIIIFQIIPQIILVFLLYASWIFKVDIFYSFIFIGIIPFIHKYVKYSIKMHYIEMLDEKYAVCVVDKAYMDRRGKLTKKNKYRGKCMSVKSFIKFKIEQEVYQKSKVKYQGLLLLRMYRDFTDEDYNSIRKDYYNFMPKILKLGIFYEMYSNLEQDIWIKRIY